MHFSVFKQVNLQDNETQLHFVVSPISKFNKFGHKHDIKHWMWPKTGTAMAKLEWTPEYFTV